MIVLSTAHATSTAPPSAFFDRWADMDTWSQWDDGIRWVRRDGPFAAGTRGSLKPRSGPKVGFVIETLVPDREFTDRSSLPGAALPSAIWWRSTERDGPSSTSSSPSMVPWPGCGSGSWAGGSPSPPRPGSGVWSRWRRPTPPPAPPPRSTGELLARRGVAGPCSKGRGPGRRPDRPRGEGRTVPDAGRGRAGLLLAAGGTRQHRALRAFTAIGVVADDELWQADEGASPVAAPGGLRHRCRRGAARAGPGRPRTHQGPNWGYSSPGPGELSPGDFACIAGAMGSSR